MDDRYEVSNLGRVRSWAKHGPGRARRTTPLIMRLQRHPAGYWQVRLGRENQLVHRLVALAFLGPPPTTEHEVAHGNGDRADERLSNLRWATKSENHLDRTAHGTNILGEANPAAVLDEAAVALIRSSDLSSKLLALRFGVCVTTIKRVRAGATWKEVA